MAAEQLQLLVDGEPRPIVDLMEIDATTLEPANQLKQGGETPESPANRLSVTSLAPSNATPPAARRRFMVFIDLSAGRIAGLTARAAARDFVDDIARPGDLIGVTTFSTDAGLRYVVPFTSDRGLVREALDKARTDLSQPDQRGSELATLQDLIAEESAAFGAEGNESSERLIEQLQEFETNISAERLLDAIEEMSAALANIQGRKQVVFFSTGFPDGALWDPEVRLSMNAAAEAARRTEVVIHTFHPGVMGRDRSSGGSFTGGGFSLPNERPQGVVLGDATPPRSRGALGNDRDALYFLSGETGGTSTFFKHTLRDGLEDMEHRSRHYYTLAFQVRDGDPEEVGIKILARDPDVNVEWAPTRLLLKAPERDSAGEQFQVASALEFGSDATGMDLAAAVLPQPMRNGFGRFATLLEVPHEQMIRLLQTGDDDRVGFELLGLALTPAGKIADRFRGRIQIAAAAAQLGRSAAPLRYQNLLALPPGEFIIKLLLREQEVGQLTSRTFRVVVPAAPGIEFAVSAPVEVVADGGRSTVQGTALGGLPEHRRELPLDNPFVIDGGVLSPRVGPLTLTGQPLDVFVTVHNFTPHPFTGQHRLSAQAWIEDPAGGRYSVDTVVLATEQVGGQPTARVLLRLAPPGAVLPGDHRLVVEVTDHVAGFSTQSSAVAVVWR